MNYHRKAVPDILVIARETGLPVKGWSPGHMAPLVTLDWAKAKRWRSLDNARRWLVRQPGLDNYGGRDKFLVCATSSDALRKFLAQEHTPGLNEPTFQTVNQSTEFAQGNLADWPH